MSAQELLSQEEINALLSTVANNDDAETPFMAPGVARLYDFSRQERRFRGQMPMLELIYERLATDLPEHLEALFHTPVNVHVEAIKTLSFRDYIKGCALPTSLHFLQMKPLQGCAVIGLDARLVFVMVDQFFGNRTPTAPGKLRQEFTPTETRVIEKVRAQLFTGIQQAWSLLQPLELSLVAMESNPDFANRINPNEMLLQTVLHLSIAGHSGTLKISMPLAMLEPLRDRLATTYQGDSSERDDHWRKQLREEIKAASVSLSAKLATAQISLRQLLALSPGDIIPITLLDKAIIRAEGVPVFHGEYGNSNGKNAIKLQGRVPLSSHQ